MRVNVRQGTFGREKRGRAGPPLDEDAVPGGCDSAPARGPKGSPSFHSQAAAYLVFFLESLVTLRSIAVSALALAVVAGMPLTSSAMDKMMSPMKHQCRDKKGHFIKGMYAKCPAGTHKA